MGENDTRIMRYAYCTYRSTRAKADSSCHDFFNNLTS